METITCSCGAKVTRPVGSSSVCGTCGETMAVTPLAVEPSTKAP